MSVRTDVGRKKSGVPKSIVHRILTEDFGMGKIYEFLNKGATEDKTRMFESDSASKRQSSK